jgi:hypothetical protein
MNNNTENYDYTDYSSENSYPELEDLESRIEDLENNQDQSSGGDYSGAILIYIPGLVLAMILSYTVNHSILWAILHGYLSWFYIIYNVIF